MVQTTARGTLGEKDFGGESGDGLVPAMAKVGGATALAFRRRRGQRLTPASQPAFPVERDGVSVQAAGSQAAPAIALVKKPRRFISFMSLEPAAAGPPKQAQFGEALGGGRTRDLSGAQ
jgi:hypothetical protein